MKIFAKKGYQNPFRIYFKNGSWCRAIEIKTDKMLYAKKRKKRGWWKQTKKNTRSKYLRIYHPSKKASIYLHTAHKLFVLWKWWSNFFFVSSFVQNICLKHAYFATMLHLFSRNCEVMNSEREKKTRREMKTFTHFFLQSILKELKEDETKFL